MRTDALIAALSADSATRTPAFNRALVFAVAIAIGVAAIAFAITLGVRPDLAAAAATPRFLFKVLVTMVLFCTALPLFWRLGRPDADVERSLRALAVAPVLVIAGAGVELLSLAPSEWGRAATGTNAVLCLTAIPLLAMGPLAVILAVLKRGAPVQPLLAGASAGLLSAGLAATLYALHCFDDSPLFVVVWYSLGTGVVTLLAAVVGYKVLRW